MHKHTHVCMHATRPVQLIPEHFPWGPWQCGYHLMKGSLQLPGVSWFCLLSSAQVLKGLKTSAPYSLLTYPRPLGSGSLISVLGEEIHTFPTLLTSTIELSAPSKLGY